MNFLLLIITTILFSFFVNANPIPKDNKATFDVLRKNKIIGSVETTFNQKDDRLIVKTVVDIKVKVFLIPAYKFFQESIETWENNNFIKFEGQTDFEDEREYFIKGKDIENNFIATGMDGQIILDKNILPLNYWNKNILKENEIFDTQKGIVRKIKVEKIADEELELNGEKIETEKCVGCLA